MTKPKLSRKFQPRKRLMKNQLSSLILFDKVKTTKAKAKVLKSQAQKLICDISKLDSLQKIRRAKRELFGGAAIKIVDEIGKIKSVSLFNLSPRSGDGAPQALVVINKVEEKKSKTKSVK